MCQITEPTEHKIKLLLGNQQGLWARLCLSSKNWYSPTDSLRHLMLLHPNFLYKILECQKYGKGKAQHGEHLIFHFLWLSQDPQNTQDGAKHCTPLESPPHNPAFLILSSRLSSSWSDLGWRAEITLYCHILNLNISALHCVPGLSGSGSASACYYDFISALQQPFSCCTILKYDSWNDTAKVQFYLYQQLLITACFSAFGVVCLLLSFWCFLGIAFCFDLKTGEREGKVIVNLKNLCTWKLCGLFQVMQLIFLPFLFVIAIILMLIM